MKPSRSKVTAPQPDPKTFGLHEPGNKVYLSELSHHFDSDSRFQVLNWSFEANIVPQFKVVKIDLGDRQ